MSWAAVVGGVASLAGGYLASQGSRSSPQQIDPAALGSESLRTQLELAPQQFTAESLYNPLYTQLGLNNFRNTLFGAPEQQQDIFEVYPELQQQYDQQIAAAQAAGATPDQFPSKQQWLTQHISNNINSNDAQTYLNYMQGGQAGGLVDQLGEALPAIQGLQQEAATSQRTADIADVENLGPRANEAFRSANPQLTETMDALRTRALGAGTPSAIEAALTGQAQDELALGNTLSEAQQRQVQQASRAGAVSRGTGRGIGSAVNEAINTMGYGDQLQNQRRQFAGQVAQLGLQREQYGTNTLGSTAQLTSATSQDPFLTILGRPSSAVSQTQGLFGQSGLINQGPSLFNPFSSDIMSIYSGNARNQTQSNIANANNAASLYGGALDLFGSYFGSQGG